MTKLKSTALNRAKELLFKGRRPCILTGAGISAESGIKTFRDAGGLWEDHPVEKVATPEGFEEDPRIVWNFYNARRQAAHKALPNPAHDALARSPNAGSMTILTQNVDGLHQQAGSRRVIELHGSVWKVRCTRCHRISSDYPIQLPILPYCAHCEGLLRPHIVWFGEPLEEEILIEAEQAVLSCDLFLVVGTSAVVQPAASYPFMAATRGIPVIEVNLEETPVSAIATVSLRGKAGEILPEIIAY